MATRLRSVGPTSFNRAKSHCTASDAPASRPLHEVTSLTPRGTAGSDTRGEIAVIWTAPLDSDNLLMLCLPRREEEPHGQGIRDQLSGRRRRLRLPGAGFERRRGHGTVRGTRDSRTQHEGVRPRAVSEDASVPADGPGRRIELSLADPLDVSHVNASHQHRTFDRVLDAAAMSHREAEAPRLPAAGTLPPPCGPFPD